jgi:hypothetical protein
VFSGKLDPVTEQIVRTFYNDKMDRLRSRKGITDTLRDYVDQALAFKPGKDLLGHEETPDPVGALKRAREGGQPGLLDRSAPQSELRRDELTAENPPGVRPDGGERFAKVRRTPDGRVSLGKNHPRRPVGQLA